MEYFINDKDILLVSEKDNILIRRGSKLSVGFDIASSCSYVILPHSRITIETGIKLAECPQDIYLRVAPRSGLSQKGLDIGGGVIDPDYRGEIKVILINHSDTEYSLHEGEFIAQIIPEKISNCDIYLDKKRLLSNTTRGKNGFGSTDTTLENKNQ